MQVLHIGMCHAVSNGQDGEREEGDDLDDVNDDVGNGRAGHANESDQTYNGGKPHTHQHFLPRCSETGIKGLDNIRDDQAHKGDHHAGVDPVIEM